MHDVLIASLSSAVERVFGVDDREEVKDVTIEPWRNICALRIASPSGEVFAGTGWLFGPRLVVTAGHCVYLRELESWATSIEVVFGLGDGSAARKIRAHAFRTTQEWIGGHDNDDALDVGAILLPEDAPDHRPGFDVAVFPDGVLARQHLTIAGYPADRGAKTLFFARSGVDRLDERKLSYKLDTFGGQSGAPIIANVEKRSIVVGIHVAGALGDNFGVRITRDVGDLLTRWDALAGAMAKSAFGDNNKKEKSVMPLVNDVGNGRGNLTRSNSNNDSTAFDQAQAVADGHQDTVKVVSTAALIQRLTATRGDDEERLSLQAMTVGTLAVANRSSQVSQDLPVIIEYLKAGRAHGAEWLFLSLLSAVKEASVIAAVRDIMPLFPVPKSSKEGAFDFFCDLSSSDKVLLTVFSRARLRNIFNRIANGEDVGIAVRSEAGATQVYGREAINMSVCGPSIDIHSDSGGGEGGGGGGYGSSPVEMPPDVIEGDRNAYDKCVDRYTFYGAVAAVIATRNVGGATLGAAGGRLIGRYLCETASVGRESGSLADRLKFPPWSGRGLLIPDGLVPWFPKRTWPLEPSTTPPIVPEPRPIGPLDWLDWCTTDRRPPLPVPLPSPMRESAALSPSPGVLIEQLHNAQGTRLTVEKLGPTTYLLHVS